MTRSLTITISEERFATLLHALVTARNVYGVMGDMVNDQYKSVSDQFETLEAFLLEAGQTAFPGTYHEHFHGAYILREELDERYMEELFEYDEYVFWDMLSARLAWRDVYAKYGAGRVRTMSDHERIHAHADIEDAYHNEFEAHGVERLRIQNAPTQNPI